MGGFLAALPVIGGIIKSVIGDKSAREAADATNDAAASAQFAAEFGERSNRTWWDSLVDGLNRLPRPLFAIAVMAAVFIWPAVDMAGFLSYAQAIAVVPEGFWAIAVTIIAFFFGGRMQVLGKSFKMDAAQAAQAAAIAVAQQVAPAPDPQPVERMDDEAFADAMTNPAPMSNAAIDEWNRRRREGS